MNTQTPAPLRVTFFCHGRLDRRRGDLPLVAEGREQITLSATALKTALNLDIAADTLIISSPANATMQSAQEIADVLGITRKIQPSSFLSLGLLGKWIPRLMEQELKTLPAEQKDVIMVSHHAGLDFLAAALLPEDKQARLGPDKIKDGQFCTAYIPDRRQLNEKDMQMNALFAMGPNPQLRDEVALVCAQG